MSPTRLRYRPIRAAKSLINIIRDPNDTTHVFALLDSIEAGNLRRLARRLLATPVGERLYDAETDLLAVLTDRDALRALPEGSFGRAYLDFVEREDITAEGLVEASAAIQPLSDPRYEFTRKWMRDTHDLWHVATGYRGDVVGELSLLAFNYAQCGGAGIGLITLAGYVQLLRYGDEPSRRLVRAGWRRGQRARWLVATNWLELLPRPLEEVRAELGLGDPLAYDEVRVPPGESFASIARAS